MSIQAKYTEKLEWYAGITKRVQDLNRDLDAKRAAKASADDIETMLEIDDDIYHLEAEIKSLAKENKLDYVMNVHEILSEYARTNSHTRYNFVKDDFFGKFVEERLNQNNKGQLFTKYMLEIENEPVKDLPKDENIKCDTCKENMVISTVDSTVVCTRCGMSKPYFDVSVNGLTYEQEINTDTTCTFAYKRVNHFRELLAQLQAKESSDIPNEIVESVRSEFKKTRIKNVKEITKDKVRGFLKKLGYNKYYEHAHQITNVLNGTPPPSISCELYEKLSNMFYDIQAPFDQVCPADRKNFFSYNYVLYKFCELLGETETMHLFPLLKSREKLYKQDCMWRDICEILNWTFYKSV